jgi:hypothetical protein
MLSLLLLDMFIYGGAWVGGEEKFGQSFVRGGVVAETERGVERGGVWAECGVGRGRAPLTFIYARRVGTQTSLRTEDKGLKVQRTEITCLSRSASGLGGCMQIPI